MRGRRYFWHSVGLHEARGHSVQPRRRTMPEAQRHTLRRTRVRVFVPTPHSCREQGMPRQRPCTVQSGMSPQLVVAPGPVPPHGVGKGRHRTALLQFQRDRASWVRSASVSERAASNADREAGRHGNHATIARDGGSLAVFAHLNAKDGPCLGQLWGRVCPGLPHENERHADAPVGDIPAALGSCSFTVSAAATTGRGAAWQCLVCRGRSRSGRRRGIRMLRTAISGRVRTMYSVHTHHPSIHKSSFMHSWFLKNI
jgi:hypothetical protein